MRPTPKRGSAAFSGILCRLGDKWSALILMRLRGGKMRFSDIKRAMSGISQRMLTLTLKGLERDGLVDRLATGDIPPRVDYELTALGRDLLTPLSALNAWAERNRPLIHKARIRFDAAPRRAVHAQIASERRLRS